MTSTAASTDSLIETIVSGHPNYYTQSSKPGVYCTGCDQRLDVRGGIVHEAMIRHAAQEAAAAVWDAGFAAGFYKAQTIHNTDPDRELDASEVDATNPYTEVD